jgi:hypothetical protein
VSYYSARKIAAIQVVFASLSYYKNPPWLADAGYANRFDNGLLVLPVFHLENSGYNDPRDK